ncbi:hypothetical protein H311_05105, partial [Anncaliia algerae PRA109]
MKQLIKLNLKFTMSIIDERLKKEIISEDALNAYKSNQKTIEKIKPTLSLIKAEHIKNMEVCLSYDNKLSEASNQLNFIEKRNKDLQNEITFLTK